MKCLICGKETTDTCVCSSCGSKVTEELCINVARYNYGEPDNELWAEIIATLEVPYIFRDFSLELVECISAERRRFVTMQCMNAINVSNLGVSKRYRDYVIAHGADCIKNDSLDFEEQNLVKALLLGCYVQNFMWDSIGNMPEEIVPDKVFLETSLILADYYMKITNYEKALSILARASDDFSSESDKVRIAGYITDCRERESGKKKAYRPSKREDIENFNSYLDKLGVEHVGLANDKNKKIKEADFKPFVRYEQSSIPENYVAIWITTEFYLKIDEAVEVSAIRVRDGKPVDHFHTFVRPLHLPKKPKFVKEEDYKNAPTYLEVFKNLTAFIQNDILAIAGFDEQKKHLSRLARYSMIDHIDNKIFDVVEFGEDISDDFTTYTRSTLLEKYRVSEGKSGMEKAEATVNLVEKMR